LSEEPVERLVSTVLRHAEFTKAIADRREVIAMHVFHQEMRDFYEIERPYGDVARVKWNRRHSRPSAPARL